MKHTAYSIIYRHFTKIFLHLPKIFFDNIAGNAYNIAFTI